jgi:hypothetical protein
MPALLHACGVECGMHCKRQGIDCCPMGEDTEGEMWNMWSCPIVRCTHSEGDVTPKLPVPACTWHSCLTTHPTCPHPWIGLGLVMRKSCFSFVQAVLTTTRVSEKCEVAATLHTLLTAQESERTIVFFWFTELFAGPLSLCNQASHFHLLCSYLRAFQSLNLTFNRFTKHGLYVPKVVLK